MNQRANAAWTERLRKEHRVLAPALLAPEPSGASGASPRNANDKNGDPQQPQANRHQRDDVRDLLRQISIDEQKMKQGHRDDTLQGLHGGIANGAFVAPPIKSLQFPSSAQQRAMDAEFSQRGRAMDSMVAAGITTAKLANQQGPSSPHRQQQQGGGGAAARRRGKRVIRLPWTRDENDDMDILAHQRHPAFPAGQKLQGEGDDDDESVDIFGNARLKGPAASPRRLVPQPPALPLQQQPQHPAGQQPPPAPPQLTTLVHDSSASQMILGSGRTTPRASGTSVFSSSTQPRPPSAAPSTASSIASSAAAMALKRALPPPSSSTKSKSSAAAAGVVDALEETQRRVAHLEQALDDERKGREEALRRMESLAARLEAVAVAGGAGAARNEAKRPSQGVAPPKFVVY